MFGEEATDLELLELLDNSLFLVKKDNQTDTSKCTLRGHDTFYVARRLATSTHAQIRSLSKVNETEEIRAVCVCRWQASCVTKR